MSLEKGGGGWHPTSVEGGRIDGWGLSGAGAREWARGSFEKGGQRAKIDVFHPMSGDWDRDGRRHGCPGVSDAQRCQPAQPVQQDSLSESAMSAGARRGQSSGEGGGDKYSRGNATPHIPSKLRVVPLARSHLDQIWGAPGKNRAEQGWDIGPDSQGLLALDPPRAHFA